jgi:hypothetical protein
MPFIQTHIAAGLTHAQKRRLIREIVAVTCSKTQKARMWAPSRWAPSRSPRPRPACCFSFR